MEDRLSQKIVERRPTTWSLKEDGIPQNLALEFVSVFSSQLIAQEVFFQVVNKVFIDGLEAGSGEESPACCCRKLSSCLSHLFCEGQQLSLLWAASHCLFFSHNWTSSILPSTPFVHSMFCFGHFGEKLDF